MEEYKYIILGGGPAGLVFANRLLELGETSFIVLEKEMEAGGLCRSKMVDGSELDIGGGHFLDAKNDIALKYIFRFMPKMEWNKFRRISTIRLKNAEIDYPFESNIWQFPIEKQLSFLLSILKAGCTESKKRPQTFIDWINWKFGKQVAQEYMIPYNEKTWSIDLHRLGTYWLNKLPDFTPEEVLLSCLIKKPKGHLPAHVNFFYPKKFGYGEVWKRMAKKLGNKIRYKVAANSFDVKNRIINRKYRGSVIVVTIPWKSLAFSPNISTDIHKAIDSLEYTSMRTTYYPERVNTKAHWTYIPEKSISYHRCLYRFNFRNGARGYWTETNEKRSEMFLTSGQQFWINTFAYPLNLVNKPRVVKKILAYFSKGSIFGLGRWGEWEHMNSDVVVIKALDLADKLVFKHKLQ